MAIPVAVVIWRSWFVESDTLLQEAIKMAEVKEVKEMKEVKEKTLLERSIKGTVKWYSVRGHYGFIAREDGKGDVFVHQSAISKSKMEKQYYRTLGDDEKVEFDLVQGLKGPEASSVTGPEGAEVQGSRYYKLQFTFRRFMPRRRPVEKDDEGNDGANGDQPQKRHRRFFTRRYRKKSDNEGADTENANGEESKEGVEEKPKKRLNRKFRPRPRKVAPGGQDESKEATTEESAEKPEGEVKEKHRRPKHNKRRPKNTEASEVETGARSSDDVKDDEKVVEELTEKVEELKV